MARSLSFMSAGRTSPDERHLTPADRKGPQLVLRVISEDLKGQPVHEIPLTRKQALQAIRELSTALEADMP